MRRLSKCRDVCSVHYESQESMKEREREKVVYNSPSLTLCSLCIFMNESLTFTVWKTEAFSPLRAFSSSPFMNTFDLLCVT